MFTPDLSASEGPDSSLPFTQPHITGVLMSARKRFQHIIINVRCSWLHGDERGFRSRDHRIHSSGDYKHRPPADEHDGLRQHHRQRSAPPRYLPQHLHECIGQTILAKINEQRHAVLSVSVDGAHVHALVELPDDRTEVKRIVGLWKQAASFVVRDELPGRIWSEGCDPILIRDAAHRRKVFNYILDHASKGAWTWSCMSASKNPALRSRSGPA